MALAPPCAPFKKRHTPGPDWNHWDGKVSWVCLKLGEPPKWLRFSFWFPSLKKTPTWVVSVWFPSLSLSLFISNGATFSRKEPHPVPTPFQLLKSPGNHTVNSIPSSSQQGKTKTNNLLPFRKWIHLNLKSWGALCTFLVPKPLGSGNKRISGTWHAPRNGDLWDQGAATSQSSDTVRCDTGKGLTPCTREFVRVDSGAFDASVATWPPEKKRKKKTGGGGIN